MDSDSATDSAIIPAHTIDATPGWQRLDIGSIVRFAPEGWMGLRNGVALRVADAVFEERIVLRAAPPELPWDAVWSFHIEPHWEDRCRLIVRRRIGMRYPGEILGAELFAPLIALFTRRMLIGLKHSAETDRERGFSQDVDVAKSSPLA